MGDERPAGASQAQRDLPLLTVDLDGVVARPLFGVNLGVHRTFLDPAAEPKPAVVWPRWIAHPWDRLRYRLRSPLPEVRGALDRLSRVRRLVVVTGRRTHPGGWLKRHRLDGYFDDVMFNEGMLRSPHYKLGVVRALGAAEHIDDDPRTAQLLAEAGGIRVYLREWRLSRGLRFHERVTVVKDLAELADRLEAQTQTQAQLQDSAAQDQAR